MKIDEIIIDGFKSYSVRTVISGWDAEFNAITGLNGSGKSNILDSICFVLGITNMTTVRAQNLQDLIYKRGQAGVTKASVTIVFDNKDSAKSPIGFEEYAQISVTRQVVMGGQSKYLINGHRAQQQTVQNLFQSVQLNVNNPNFLIMQGKITKVLNMKPVEILAMIEEAAGTRMFEDRKEKAFKTMAKKESKVVEINGLLQEEIEPKLEILRTEKRAFLEFQQTQSDLERMQKLVVAHDFVKLSSKLEDTASAVEGQLGKKKTLETLVLETQKEIKALDEDAVMVKKRRDSEMKKGGQFQALETEVKEKSHEMVRLGTLVDLKKGTVLEEQQKLDQIQETLNDLKSQLADKHGVFMKKDKSYCEIRAKYETQQKDVEKQEELLQTLSTGISAKAGQENGYMEQLQDARLRLSQAKTETQQIRLRIKDLSTRCKKDEVRGNASAKENSHLQAGLEKLRSEAAHLKSQLVGLGWEEGKEKQFLADKKSLEKKVHELTAQSEDIKRKVSNIDFTYSDPGASFNPSKVKGVIAQLFTINPGMEKAVTALEVCAGGRLYNVVVEDESTAKQLLEKGKLRRRVTIIPLNKITPFNIPSAKIEAAKKLAPGKVDLALSLVGSDEELSMAMQFVFGGTFVCADPDAARLITFNPSIRTKCVTLDGDVYDPSGTLSGGSASTSSGILIQVQSLNKVSRELATARQNLEQVINTLQQNSKKLAQTHSISKSLDLKLHEISLSENQINSNFHSKLLAEIEKMKKTIEELQNESVQTENNEAAAKADIERIEADLKEFSQNKGSKLSKLQMQLKKLKEDIARQSESMRNLHQEHQSLEAEIDQLKNEISSTDEQFNEASSILRSSVDELACLEQEHAHAKAQLAECERLLDLEKAKMSEFNEELATIERLSSEKTKQISEMNLEIQKLTHSLGQCITEQQNSTKELAGLTASYEWIEDEKQYFGQKGSAYDYASVNIGQCKTQVKIIAERFHSLKRKVNPKVMNMIDNVEKKELGLKNMLRTVVKDKSKIEETIESLEQYKKEALQKTWEKVNADFGNIFAMLLPGSFARLDPPAGKSISDGLEVKVCLGKVWKEGLAELSGGQRSLIALSLIMSLLQFKPAPMYILDEVDAALDLSHTQNIGKLIKTRFKGSQFIVVSLKEGMFTNANRIYRTRFVDGTSQVTMS